ncbi:MAG: hypothetical protein J6D18_03260, partial [Erysipelotrichaceae bacterium]|nr:hypothetical protein [Erysipelotrichaceae bacterium]
HLANYKDSVTVQCDLLKVDGEYAVNTVSFGFDVHIAENVNRFRSLFKGEGTTPYYTGMLASLVTLKNDVYKIQLDQEKLPEQEEMFVVFGNGQYYGGGYRPCPQAQPDDGQMDVCLVHPLPKHKLIQLADVYRTGQHVQLDGLTKLYTAKVAHLDTDNLLVSANLDGEIRRVINPTIELCPGMIRLALPIKKTGE